MNVDQSIVIEERKKTLRSTHNLICPEEIQPSKIMTLHFLLRTTNITQLFSNPLIDMVSLLKIT